ncbi:MAG: NADH-quinone oxidoreductase subunit N [Kineosporiaceae bacterium]|nr:NADH-quinone oxidoreductase subunit N [Kineosporiaceae bacterium]MBK8075837.1 NADH-quinone oxidoreductase subunit N [Kineosporiaceae bacterium]
MIAARLAAQPTLGVGVSWDLLAVVIAPVVAVVLVLLLDALAPAGWRGGRLLTALLDGVSLLGLLAAGGFLVWQWRSPSVALGQRTPTLCGGTEDSLGLSQCAWMSSGLTLTLQSVVVLAALVTLLLALDGSGARDRTAHHVLFLTAVTGALALAGVRDVVSLMVALELATLPAVGLVGLRRDAAGAQGALTFLYTAIVSLGLLALGAGMLLLATGSLYLQQISIALSDPAVPGSARAVAVLGVVFALAGVGYKLSLVPFHLWTPDTYAGAPLPVAAFLSTVSKIAGLAAVVMLLMVGAPSLGAVWAPLVGFVAVATMTVGNILALRQHVAVRLLAWSTVAQAGWVLLPLAAGAPGATFGLLTAGNPQPVVAASVGYLAAYVAASLAAFGVVVVLSRHVVAAEEHTLDSYRGLARREPVAAAVLGFALLCLAGLPPGVMGLIAKLLAVRPLVDAGAWFFAVAAALNVALGVAYYLRWTALLVAAPATSDDGTPLPVPTWQVRPAEGLAIAAGALACLLLSVHPQLLAGLLRTGLL